MTTQHAPIYRDIRYLHSEPLDPEPSPQTTLRGHLQLVAAVERAGITPPADWQAINKRLGVLQETVTAESSVLLARLCDAVTQGPVGDIPTRLAAASVQISPDVVEACHAHVHGALKAAAAPAARRNYITLAARFDRAAERFTKLAGLVDVEGTADALVGDSKRLSAWEEAPIVAAEMTALVAPLAAAAVLSRHDHQPCRLGSDPATFELPLTVDTDGANYRSVWLAWHEHRETQVPTDTLMLSHLTSPTIETVQHRCGRWNGILAAGARIDAHPQPGKLELTGTPAPRRVRHDRNTGRATEVVDPTDTPKNPSALRRWLTGRRTPQTDTPVDVLATVAEATDHG